MKAVCPSRMYSVLCVLSLIAYTTFYLVDNEFLVGFFMNGDTENELPTSSQKYYSTTESSRYLIWSENCKIRERDPYDKSIRNIIRLRRKFTCSAKKPLTYITYTKNYMPVKYKLQINYAEMHSYAPNGNISCCYSNITRVNIPDGSKYDRYVDMRTRVGPCKKFIKNMELEPEEEFVLVKCKREEETVYENMHAVVPIKKRISEGRRKRQFPDDDDRLNVLIIGYDSISQLNLIRTMPNTVAYLQRAGFVNLHGFNKVGGNTFPNVLALLTGFNVSDATRECWPSTYHKIDNCPFMWNDYRKHGYVTAYIEDRPHISAFNYLKTGFANPPTDYYFRPFMMTAEKHLGTAHDGACLGAARTSDVIMKYILNFVRTFKNYLLFCFAWLSHFGHSDLNEPQNMDLITLQFFNELNGTGILKRSLVVFMSDHGINFGPFAQTFQGWFESRMPYAYFLFPEWFKRKYANLYKNFLTNRRRLVSVYDIHITLKEILRIPQNLTSASIAPSCLTCKSLFSGDVGDRTCAEAGIPPQWCTCSHFEELPENNTITQPAMKYIMGEIQSILTKSNYSRVCAKLGLKKLLSSKVDVDPLAKKNVYEDYLIMFQTTPGDGIFESYVRYVKNNNRFFLREVLRINSHTAQSKCTEDLAVQMYCYCIPSS